MTRNVPRRRRFYLRNVKRFILVLLVFFLCLFALIRIFSQFNAISKLDLIATGSASTSNPPLKETPAKTPGPTSASSKSEVIVVVDPGHGGRDPGAVSPYQDGFYEKDITLDIGLRVKQKLEEAGIQVVMTRDTDKELDSYWKEDVWARPRTANEANAAFFISIHVNSIENAPDINGTEIYHYGKTHGSFTSEQFAGMMGEEIGKVTNTKYNGVFKQDLGVLRLSGMPALLVETAYITNKDDHKKLESDTFREDMAEGILNGTLRILEGLGIEKEDGVYRMPRTD